MKLLCVLGLPLAAAMMLVAGDRAPDPRLSGVQTVYILPMSAGMDQYLANRLTELHVVQVAADPQNADAILTDKLGETFERRMADLYPKPAPPKTSDDEDGDNTDKPASSSIVASIGSTPPPVSSFGRGRGNYFLVDRKTHNVLWSVYEKPEGSRSEQLTRTADKIAKEFRDARTPKQ